MSIREASTNVQAQTLTRRRFLLVGGVAGASLLAGCAGGRNAADSQEAADTQTDETPQETDASDSASTTQAGNTLVVFYSRADENYAGGGTEWLEVGHTKVMAGYIAEALGADTYEIVPQQAYPEGYDDCCDVALDEQRADARPAIAGDLPDVSGYDMVLIGCPIWWGDEPMIVRTFVEGVDLAGKIIVPFTTHGGSGLANVPANLQAALPDSLFLDGLAVAGTSVDGARDEVVSWAQGLASA